MNIVLNILKEAVMSNATMIEFKNKLNELTLAEYGCSKVLSADLLFEQFCDVDNDLATNLIVEMLADYCNRIDKDNDTVLLMSGGNGSGKSSFLKNIHNYPLMPLSNKLDEYVCVLDVSLNQIELARNFLNIVLQRGKKVAHIYILADPVVCFRRVLLNNRSRKKQDVFIFIKNHLSSLDVCLQLAKEYGENIKTYFVNNNQDGLEHIRFECLTDYLDGVEEYSFVSLYDQLLRESLLMLRERKMTKTDYRNLFRS
jgi:hypothetical protein